MNYKYPPKNVKENTSTFLFACFWSFPFSSMKGGMLENYMTGNFSTYLSPINFLKYFSFFNSNINCHPKT